MSHGLRAARTHGMHGMHGRVHLSELEEVEPDGSEQREAGVLLPGGAAEEDARLRLDAAAASRLGELRHLLEGCHAERGAGVGGRSGAGRWVGSSA